MKGIVLFVAATLLLLPSVQAHAGGTPGVGTGPSVWPESEPIVVPRGEPPCPLPNATWREGGTHFGVEVAPSNQCYADDPRSVAAFVAGTNNVPRDILDELGLHPDAVVKGNDMDGDGDPDVINITLEVIELNGWEVPEDTIQGEGFRIAPGIAPGFWVFAPKTARFHGGPVDLMWRVPSAPIRVEQNDIVNVRLENTHYLPHTLHLHGVDHPFQDADGEGNDGVPVASERPVAPGDVRTYTFRARQPGTMFYHCHVQPQVHVAMGLHGAFIIEEDRPDNRLQTFNLGGGKVRHPSAAVQEKYDQEYDLHYQDVDRELHSIVQASPDPRVLSRMLHREYDATQAHHDYFLVNGRSFPYTMRESLLLVEEDQTIKIRVLNGGVNDVALHTHGHKTTATHADGIPLPEPITRDVHDIAAAQRLDLELNTSNDGLHSYGPGAWLIHDHQEFAVTTGGINPGGDITLITYPDHQDPDTKLPVAQGERGWSLYFTEEYYRGEIPVFIHMGEDNILGQADYTFEEPPPQPIPHPWLLAPLALALSLLARRRWHR